MTQCPLSRPAGRPLPQRLLFCPPPSTPPCWCREGQARATEGGGHSDPRGDRCRPPPAARPGTGGEGRRRTVGPGLPLARRRPRPPAVGEPPASRCRPLGPSASRAGLTPSPARSSPWWTSGLCAPRPAPSASATDARGPRSSAPSASPQVPFTVDAPLPDWRGPRRDARPSAVLGSTVDTERPARGGLVQCRWDDRGRGQRQVNVAASGSRPRLKPQRQSEGTQPGRPDRELGQDTWAAGLQRGSAGESGARGHSAGGRKESPHFPMLGPSGAGAFALGQGPHSRVAQRLAPGQEGGGRQRGGRRPLFTVGPGVLSCALGTIDGSGRQGMHFALTWRGSAAPQ